jgi:hypothetical protein
MADRLIVVATRNIPANIAAVQAVPIQGGWGSPGYIARDANPTAIATWGAWSSTALPGTRAGLVALRDAGTIRLAIWEPDGESAGSIKDETQSSFLSRCRTLAAGA